MNFCKIFFIVSVSILNFSSDICSAESLASLSGIKKARDEVLLWNYPEIQIKAESDLCMLPQSSYHLAKHYVTSCESLFQKTLDTYLSKGVAYNTQDSSVYILDGLFRYMVHALHQLRENSISDNSEKIIAMQKVLLLLLKTSKNFPERFSQNKISSILNPSYIGLLPLLFSVEPDQSTRELYLLLKEEGYFEKKAQQPLSKTIVQFFFLEKGEVFEQSVNVMRFLQSKIVYLIQQNAEPPVLNSIQTTKQFRGIISYFSLDLILRMILVLACLSIGVLILYYSYATVLQIKKNRTNFSQEFEILNSTDRAELRDLRQFFELHPTEGITSLHKKYRLFVRDLHPDVIQDSGESFLKLQERYNRARILLLKLEEEKTKRMAV